MNPIKGATPMRETKIENLKNEKSSISKSSIPRKL